MKRSLALVFVLLFASVAMAQPPQYVLDAKKASEDAYIAAFDARKVVQDLSAHCLQTSSGVMAVLQQCITLGATQAEVDAVLTVLSWGAYDRGLGDAHISDAQVSYDAAILIKSEGSMHFMMGQWEAAAADFNAAANYWNAATAVYENLATPDLNASHTHYDDAMNLALALLAKYQ